MNFTNKKLIRIRRTLNNKHGRQINRHKDERDEYINIETVKKVRDKNSKNVKDLLVKIKTNIKDANHSNEHFEKTLNLLNETKDQIIYLQEKNKKLSDDLIEKINKIRSLYRNNKNLWTDIIGTISNLYDDGPDDNQEPDPNSLSQSNNTYTTFNYLHKELIQ